MIKPTEKILANYKLKYEFDKGFFEKGLVAGIDEVGRGPLAGPVVCACVLLDYRKPILGIDDSKKLSEKKREYLYNQIVENSIDYSIGMASIEEIDELNILNATKLAMKRAVEGLKTPPDTLLLDAVTIDTKIDQNPFVKGDEKSLAIGAASILAKVHRDRMMKKHAKQYPGYGFETNMGYGTKVHMNFLKDNGPCPIHRKSFIKNIVGKEE